MLSNIPQPFRQAMMPLVEALPFDQAMTRLVPAGPASADAVARCADVVADPVFADHPALQAGLWMYVDELTRSHDLSQAIASPGGSYWHAIMHRREGDYGNSKYWYRQLGTHPVWSELDLSGGPGGGGTDVGGFDPYDFVDRVQNAVQAGRDQGNGPPELIVTQQREWLSLFHWCAER